MGLLDSYKKRGTNYLTGPNFQAMADNAPVGSVGAPGGLLAPPPAKVPGNPLRGLLAAGSMTPGPVGDFTGLIADALMYYEHPETRKTSNYAMSMLGALLPFMPAAAGMVQGSKYSVAEALEEAKKLSPDVKRAVNPADWADDLGGAAWYDRRTPGLYHAVHVTDNPGKAGKVIKQGGDVTQEYRGGANLGELGSGLYMSARPEFWAARAADGARKDIPVSVAGDFVEFGRPWDPQLEAIKALGFDGAYMRAGMASTPQLVVWNTDAIKSFGKHSKRP